MPCGVAQAAAYYPLKETEDAATAVLAMAFPTYAAAALRKVPLASLYKLIKTIYLIVGISKCRFAKFGNKSV